MRFHISRHEPTLFYLKIASLECAEVHVAACEGNARGFLVFFELGGIDAVNLIKVLIEPSGIVGRIAKHVREIYVVE